MSYAKVWEKNMDIWRSIVEKKIKKERKKAMLSNQRWRKNLIMLRSNHDYPISAFPHTCTPWTECMIFSSIDSLFDIAIYVMQVCFTLILPKLHISLLEVWRKANTNALVRIYTPLSDLRITFEEKYELSFQLQKL